MAIHESGNYVACSTQDGLISMIDSRTGTVMKFIRSHSSNVNKMGFLDENHLLSVSNDKGATVWNLENPLQPQKKLSLVGHNEPILSFSYFDNVIITSTSNKIGITTLNLNQIYQNNSLKVNLVKLPISKLQPVSNIEYLPNHQLLAISNDDNLNFYY